jgi:hypothetical protein
MAGSSVTNGTPRGSSSGPGSVPGVDEEAESWIAILSSPRPSAADPQITPAYTGSRTARAADWTRQGMNVGHSGAAGGDEPVEPDVGERTGDVGEDLDDRHQVKMISPPAAIS